MYIYMYICIYIYIYCAWPPVIQHEERNLTKYWDLTETCQRIEFPSWTKSVTVR